MKKILTFLMCIACLACILAGCKNVEVEPTKTSKNVKSEKTLVWQEDVPGVFSVEKCEFNLDKSTVTTQIRNDSDKVMTSFDLLLQFFDENDRVIKDIRFGNDYPLFIESMKLAPERNYSIKNQSLASHIAVYVTDVTYEGGSVWTNKDLVLSEKSQLPVKMEKEISGIYSIEQCKMDITKLELQLKNLSQDKTINFYSLLVRYLDDVGNEEMYSTFKLDYDGAQIKPSDSSERKVWGVSPWQYKSANCYISEIVYSDGTKWNNPNIPPQKS